MYKIPIDDIALSINTEANENDCDDNNNSNNNGGGGSAAAELSMYLKSGSSDNILEIETAKGVTFSDSTSGASTASSSVTKPPVVQQYQQAFANIALSPNGQPINPYAPQQFISPNGTITKKPSRARSELESEVRKILYESRASTEADLKRGVLHPATLLQTYHR